VVLASSARVPLLGTLAKASRHRAAASVPLLLRPSHVHIVRIDKTTINAPQTAPTAN
jgi:hypothetical protein